MSFFTLGWISSLISKCVGCDISNEFGGKKMRNTLCVYRRNSVDGSFFIHTWCPVSRSRTSRLFTRRMKSDWCNILQDTDLDCSDLPLFNGGPGCPTKMPEFCGLVNFYTAQKTFVNKKWRRNSFLAQTVHFARSFFIVSSLETQCIYYICAREKILRYNRL